MRKVLFFLLFFTCSGLAGAPLFLSLKIPASYGLVAPEDYGNWNGFVWGTGLSAEINFTSIVFIEYEIFYTSERFSLPEKYFLEETYISMRNLENSLNAKVYFSGPFYAGLGLKFITQMSGGFGSRDVEEREIGDDYLGTDMYLNFLLGCRLPVTARIFLPVEIRLDHDLTISDSTVFRAGLTAGIGMKFDIAVPEKK